MCKSNTYEENILGGGDEETAPMYGSYTVNELGVPRLNMTFRFFLLKVLYKREDDNTHSGFMKRSTVWCRTVFFVSL